MYYNFYTIDYPEINPELKVQYSKINPLEFLTSLQTSLMNKVKSPRMHLHTPGFALVCLLIEDYLKVQNDTTHPNRP